MNTQSSLIIDKLCESRQNINEGKDMVLTDLLLLRAAYDSDLHRAIEKGNQKAVDKWLDDYRKDKSNAIELSWYKDVPVKVSELKKQLAKMDKEYDDAHARGQKIFGE